MDSVSDSGSAGVVLLSGGLDSTVAAALALRARTAASALFFDYGQIAAMREEAAARAIAAHCRLGFEALDISWLGRISRSALARGSEGAPDLPEHASRLEAQRASRAVWVENRNAIFINIGAAFAAARGGGVIVTGFNREEAERFPDNSERFVEAVNRALEISAGEPVRVVSPTLGMDKRAIAAAGIELGIPWEALWSCYRDGERMCGRCESCMSLRRAIVGTAAWEAVRFESS